MAAVTKIERNVVNAVYDFVDATKYLWSYFENKDFSEFFTDFDIVGFW